MRQNGSGRVRKIFVLIRECPVMKYFIIYAIVISAVSVLTTIADKRKAVGGKYRISEKTLFALALLGGSMPMFITMKAIRHKTKHAKFMIGLPIIFVLQFILICKLTIN